MRKVAALLLLCAFLAPGASAGQPIPGRVLSHRALGGPAQAGDRVAWFEPTGRRGCAHLAVRDTRTLRHHDLGTRACPYEGVPIAFTYGAGMAYWVDDFCGNDCYQDESLLSPGGTFSSGEREDIAYDDYTGLGTRIAAVAGDGRYLATVTNTRVVAPDAPEGACEGGNACPTVLSRSELSVLTSPTHGVALRAPWPLADVALAGDSIGLEQAGTGVVQIRNLRTGRIESTIPNAGEGSIRLSPSYLAVIEERVATIYRRSDRSVAMVAELNGYDMALSDAGFENA